MCLSLFLITYGWGFGLLPRVFWFGFVLFCFAGGGWLDHTIDMCIFNFVLPQCFPKWLYYFLLLLYYFTFLLTVMKFPVPLLSCLHFIWFIFLNFNHSNRCVEISYCGFNLCILNTSDLSMFRAFICPPCILLGEVSIQVFGPLLLGCLFSHQ